MLTEIRISRSALVHNVRAFRKVVGPTVRLMAVVKSNAYGHGVGECAPIFEGAGADWFGVASVREALQLKKVVRSKPILALSILDGDDADIARAIRSKIRLPVYTVKMLVRIQRIAQRTHLHAMVHVKFDTGTTRIGFVPPDLPHVIRQCKRSPHVTVEGVYSHFAEVESTRQTFSQLQHERFAILATALERGIGKSLIKHMDCSAGVLVHPDAHFDMVRVGMSLYGIQTVADTHRVHVRYPKFSLQPMLSWYTTVLQVKAVPAGTSIGYNRTYRTTRPSRIAVLPIGYWDGYDRGLSNRGTVAYAGKLLPVRGRVCMNLTMVDATGTRVRAGTRLEILGSHVSAATLASMCGTIPYEVLTRINPLIPRVLEP